MKETSGPRAGPRPEAPSAGLSADLLSHSAALVQTVVDSALAAVVTMSAAGVINGWGARAEETFGWSRSEAVGRRVSELIVPERLRAAHEAGLRRFLETGEGPVLGRVVEMPAVDRNGREFPIELAISPAAKAEGTTVFIAFIRDISERTSAQNEIASLYERARAANEAMSSFVHGIVHELRGPLAVAGGYLSMIRDGSLGDPPASLAPVLEILSAKVQESSDLVDQLLDSFRLEGDALPVQMATVDLTAVTAASAERARARSRLTGGQLALRLPAGSLWVRADEMYVGRILDNLINNAINYSRGEPKVTLEVTAEPAPAVTVSDRGRGIASGLQERVFERFFRVDDHSSAPGSGLGLYLSRQLAELQRGRLELVDSAPGKGSTFRLTLAPAEG